MGVLYLMFCMLSMMNLVTVRRARMDTMFLYALVRRFGDLVGGHRLRRGRRRVGDAGCECRRGQHSGREQNGRDFPVHSHSSFRALVD